MSLRLAATIAAVVLCAGPAAAAIVGWVGIPLEVDDTPLVEVPSVIGGANFAAADATLEGVGLDGLETDPSCSEEAADEVIRQNPIAGSTVPLGSGVDVTLSSGTPCVGSSYQRLKQAIGLGL